jgi:6-phosphofructokinase 1
LRVIGIPKTIDNDLVETDHTPGYGSCARFFAHAARDIGADNRALPPPIEVLEVLGRNVGWVVAATALARSREDDPPHLIYFPEYGVSGDQLCADVERVYRRLGRCMVAVCEGQTDEAGGWFGAELITKPGARDALPANMGHVLAKLIWSRTGLRTRAEKPGLFGRSCAALASETDRAESWECGAAAVRAAMEGHTGEMVAIRRIAGAIYRSETFTTALEVVARKERQFPREWMSEARNDVTQSFVDWAKPLVGTVTTHVRL